MTDELIASLTRAVEAAPVDVPLRLHLAEQLIAVGRSDEALTHCAVALQHEPTSGRARAVMTQALAPQTHAEPAPLEPVPAQDEHASPSQDATPSTGFDWGAAERDLDLAIEPKFVTSSPPEPLADPDTRTTDGSHQGADVSGDDQPDVNERPGYRGEALRETLDPSQVGADAWEVERPTITLADVGGLQEVKDRLEMAFLAPMRNPEMRRLYGKSLKGGLLLYGPPGTGKTFLARAVAGELGARFMSIGLTDILEQWIGSSERNLHELFQQARRNAPVVLFIDEIDAIGMKRSSASMSGAMRNTINQLLVELDGVGEANEGVFVLGATNQPWDVDPALRRPGRLDRMVLVLPPDADARAAIFRHHLDRRPIEGIDLGWLAEHSAGLTGADIAYVCERATEIAMMDSVRRSSVRMIGMADLQEALRDVTSSSGEWFRAAANVVQYADPEGTYKDLRDYMRARKML